MSGGNRQAKHPFGKRYRVVGIYNLNGKQWRIDLGIRQPLPLAILNAPLATMTGNAPYDTHVFVGGINAGGGDGLDCQAV